METRLKIVLLIRHAMKYRCKSQFVKGNANVNDRHPMSTTIGQIEKRALSHYGSQLRAPVVAQHH